MDANYVSGLFSLAGRTALITGASRGIGREIALGYSRAGANVLLVARNAVELAAVADRINEMGGNAIAIPCDLASLGNIRHIFETIRDHGSSPDILVNNASIIRRGLPEQISESEWDDVFNLNLRAAFFLAQQAGRLMIERGYGKIISISSILGFGGGAHATSYAVTKGGLISMTKSLAVAWARHGIRVNSIAPGYTMTDMTDPLYADESLRDALTRRIPLGRWATTTDMVGAAIFLASSASDYVTGHTLAVDGGWLAN